MEAWKKLNFLIRRSVWICLDWCEYKLQTSTASTKLQLTIKMWPLFSCLTRACPWTPEVKQYTHALHALLLRWTLISWVSSKSEVLCVIYGLTWRTCHMHLICLSDLKYYSDTPGPAICHPSLSLSLSCICFPPFFLLNHFSLHLMID